MVVLVVELVDKVRGTGEVRDRMLLADIVVLVRTEKYGIPASASRAKAALVFAICMRLKMPSYIRAPPEAETNELTMSRLNAR